MAAEGVGLSQMAQCAEAGADPTSLQGKKAAVADRALDRIEAAGLIKAKGRRIVLGADGGTYDRAAAARRRGRGGVLASMAFGSSDLNARMRWLHGLQASAVVRGERRRMDISSNENGQAALPHSARASGNRQIGTRGVVRLHCAPGFV